MALVDTAPSITVRELAAVIRLVYEKSGITLHDGKQALIQAALAAWLETLEAKGLILVPLTAVVRRNLVSRG